jgi:LacI family transcriptional regulator
VPDTIEDVAAAAGVSRSTASRALSGHPSVRPATRERVQAAALRLGYRVDPVARALRAGSSGLLALVLTNLMNSSIQVIARTVQTIGHDNGYEVLIATTENEAARELEIVQRLRAHRVDGVIVMGSGPNTGLLNALHADGCPVVAIIRLPAGVRTPSVVYDDPGAARQAADYLLGRGHRDVAFVGGPASTRSGRLRYAGFAAALRTAAAAPRQEITLRGPFTPDFGAAAMTRILGVMPPPTAVVVANHEAMSGVLQVLAQRRVDVPARLSVVGIEDAELLRYWHPAITVVDTEPQRLGELAIETMLRQLRREPGGETRFVTDTHLVERGSVIDVTPLGRR